MKHKEYKHDFYKDRHRNTIYAANKMLSIALEVLPEVHSAVDFGCAVGTWLSVLQEKGVTDILGLDGDWVKQDMLEIPRENFHQVDLETRINLDKKYDLAISLEVAEHLRPEVAGRFVDSLVNAADFVLFSAAIPGQGGTNHINLQWQDYWVSLFKERGFIGLDIIRPNIWDEEKIASYYCQQCFLFVRQTRMKDLRVPGLPVCGEHFPIRVIHPRFYLSFYLSQITVKGSWKLFRRAVKHRIRTRINKGR